MTLNINRFKSMVERTLNGGASVPVTVTQNQDDEYDPTTGEVVSGSVEIIYSGMRLNFRNTHNFGEMVLDDDVLIYLSATLNNGQPAPEPKTGDTIVFNEVEYVIRRAHPWNFSGLDIGWKVHARIAR